MNVCTGGKGEGGLQQENGRWRILLCLQVIIIRMIIIIMIQMISYQNDDDNDDNNPSEWDGIAYLWTGLG